MALYLRMVEDLVFKWLSTLFPWRLVRWFLKEQLPNPPHKSVHAWTICVWLSLGNANNISPFSEFQPHSLCTTIIRLHTSLLLTLSLVVWVDGRSSLPEMVHPMESTCFAKYCGSSIKRDTFIAIAKNTGKRSFRWMLVPNSLQWRGHESVIYIF